MAEREYFPCYHSYLKKCEKLTDQELGRLFRALMEYSINGERQELAGRESIAFDFIADDIDRANESYLEKCAENSRKGKLGGRPKKPKLFEKPTAFLESQKSQSKYKDETKDETKDKNTPQPPILSETDFGPELQAAFADWLAYKKEKRQGYKPTGLKSLVTQVNNKAAKYGESAVANLIRQCMAANWQGIIWDKLEENQHGCKRTAGGDAAGSGEEAKKWNLEATEL